MGLVLIIVQSCLTALLVILMLVNAIIICCKKNPHRQRRLEMGKSSLILWISFELITNKHQKSSAPPSLTAITTPIIPHKTHFSTLRSNLKLRQKLPSFLTHVSLTKTLAMSGIRVMARGAMIMSGPAKLIQGRNEIRVGTSNLHLTGAICKAQISLKARDGRYCNI